jgi:hypothetical protein
LVSAEHVPAPHDAWGAAPPFLPPPAGGAFGFVVDAGAAAVALLSAAFVSVVVAAAGVAEGVVAPAAPVDGVVASFESPLLAEHDACPGSCFADAPQWPSAAAFVSPPFPLLAPHPAAEQEAWPGVAVVAAGATSVDWTGELAGCGEPPHATSAVVPRAASVPAMV